MVIEYRGIRLDNMQPVFGYPFADITPSRKLLYIIEGGFVPAQTMPSERFIEVDADSISQYIGIEDINGSKIFSNDKVKVKLPDMPNIEGATLYGMIEYDAFGARFLINIYNHKTNHFCWDYINIHEDLKIEVIREIPKL
jgi:hypothetical protein